MLEIPMELRAILFGFLTMIITQGIKALANLLSKDFSGWAAAFVAVVVAAIMVFLDGAVGLVPVEYHDVVMGVFGLIVAILSAFGIHYTRKNA